MKLTFLGATETVTGSKYLIETAERKIMIDCGLFQGRKDLRLRNWEKLPLEAREIDALLLTHAHIDHSGYVPRLIRDGFDGPVYCSPATRDLCAILLPDSGFLQEEDANAANKYGYTRHSPALPLYTEEEAAESLKKFKPVAMGAPYELGDELSFTLHRAGHILGASFIHLRGGDGTNILFSGDIGRLENPVMKSPARIQDADYLVLESTYGDRLHDDTDPAAQIGKVIRETAARGGTVLIPSFAVGRAQTILYYIHRLKKDRLIPDLPVYLDSPMAINATELMSRHINEHRLSPEECAAVCGGARYTVTSAESRAINNDNGMPKIIISASGMATGGRVLHHLKHYLGDMRNTVLLPGFQAEGTRGDRLARGEKEIAIHGHDWAVHAQIVKMDNMSSHADYAEILLWLENFRTLPRKIFLTHGEISAAQALKAKIEEKFDADVMIPSYLHTEYL